jgi:hypothetical protein
MTISTQAMAEGATTIFPYKTLNLIFEKDQSTKTLKAWATAFGHHGWYGTGGVLCCDIIYWARPDWMSGWMDA